MTALILDGHGQAELARVREYAEANQLSYAQMLRLAQGKLDPPGDDANRRCHLERGYRVVYTIEDHGSRVMRHLSVSLDNRNAAPHPHAVAMIAKELGFSVDDKLSFGRGTIIVEDHVHGWFAPNVLEELAPVPGSEAGAE